MQIGRLAKLAGITTSRIRFYEANGIIAPAARAANGYRDYDAKTADLLRFIVQSQDLGFSLDEIRDAVRLKRSHRLRHADVLAALQRKLAVVEEHIAATRKLRSNIRKMIAVVEADKALRA
jgi:DNA-binding transcriptional MerR regulator